MARRRTLTSLVVAVLALAGCSSVVPGTGSTVVAATGSGFPSTTSPPAGSTGVSVTYAAGHLRAVFPSRPTQRSVPGDIGGETFTVYIALVHDPHPLEAACEEVSSAIPSDEYQATLRAAVSGLEGSSGLTVTDQQATTFRGHPARSASLSSASGVDYSLLAFFWTSHRFYLLFGATGSDFTTLMTSFEALP